MSAADAADDVRLRTPMRLYNSLGRRPEIVTPMRGRTVRMYTCGVTVYDYAHIGNLRAYHFADVLRRTLQFKGFDVTQIVNVTDVGHLTSDADEGEDKVELAARGTSRSAYEITEAYTAAWLADLDALNIRPAAAFPRATAHIQEIIEFVTELERGGHTYRLDDGVYFDTSTVADYGRLGLLDLDDQLAGARVAADPNKRQPWDFSLWRLSPPGSTRLMEWESPWGTGFPGWHVECSVMSLKYLDGPFDIHTGGVDHRQVHHPNEIAQNQGRLGDAEPGARLWAHSEFLIMADRKMSKSSGDFWRLATLVERGVHPLVYRLFLLQAHYRSQVDFSMPAIVAARVALERMLRRVAALRAEAGAEGARLATLSRQADFTTGGSFDYLRGEFSDGLGPAAAKAVQEFDEAVSDDLATPRALAILSGVLSDAEITEAEALRVIGLADLVLGLDLLTLDPAALVIRPADAPLDDAAVDALVAERRSAREARDWARADEVRDRLTAAGVLVQDGTAGAPTTWAWQIRQ